MVNSLEVPGLNPEAVKLWASQLRDDDRILITGASGWFGKTALELCKSVQIPTFATYRKLPDQISKGPIYSGVWDEHQITQFAPTIVIDCAFITRELLKSMSLSDYISENSRLINNLIWATQLNSVSKTLTFSSGAAVFPRDASLSPVELDPYGYLKRQAEKRLKQTTDALGTNSVVARAWSVSGTFCTKFDVFAFTNIIKQALTGKIEIQASKKVFRRYVSIEDLLAVSFGKMSFSQFDVIDSGGELKEIYELALEVRNIIDPNIQVVRKPISDLNDDLYYSTNETWEIACKQLGFTPLSLQNQIKQVLNKMTDLPKK